MSQARAQVEAIIAFQNAYELDWDDVEVTRESLWVSGRNVPGHLPDMEFETSATREDAIYHIMDILGSDDEHTDSEIDGVRAEFWNGADVVYFKGMAYCVTENTEIDREILESANGYDEQDDVLTAMQDNVLDIEYRSGWSSDSENMGEWVECRILLCCGGPTVWVEYDRESNTVSIDSSEGEYFMNSEEHEACRWYCAMMASE